jgi:two-component system sensor histidine kinase RpfC
MLASFLLPLGTLRARLRQRPDSEHEQAILRIVIVAAVFIYMATIYAPARDDSRHTQLILLSTLAVDLVFAFATFLAICIWPASNVPRRIAGMFADAGTATIVVMITGEAGVSMVGVYLFITFGNGFRYGRRYLYACHVLCLVGFLTALLFTSYWKLHQVAGWSLFISLVVLPLYVATLLTRIQEARAKAEEANRAKSSFLANMSHEMRTPLNGIVGVVDLFNVTRLDNHQTELMRLLRHSVGVLRSLVDDVLDISKIEAGRLTVEVLDFDLHTMLNSLVRLLRPHAQAKGLKFQAMVDPAIDYHLQGDLHHLRQVLLNLLSNAIKFTHYGGITVNVTLISESESIVRLRFEVRDTGIGMSSEVQQKIFERFVQADESTTRRYGGTGLGTTIAKQLVELMSGDIGVTSQQGQGSVFWFEVPLTKIGSVTADGNDRQASVLLADAATATQIIPSIIEACGRVETVTTAGAVISQLRALRDAGIRVPAVLVSGDTELASTVFEAVAAENADTSTAMIYLSTEPSEGGTSDNRLDQIIGVSRITTNAPPRLLRNAIHAAAAQDIESAQVIDLGQILAEQRVARKILIAEDNQTNRTIIARLLESAGHQVLLAGDGEEALDIYENEAPELAILDFNMPLRNGLDVTKAIRTMEGTGDHLPIMILSASVTPEARENAKRAGADEFLGKPYEATALLQAIDRLARRANRSTSLSREPRYEAAEVMRITPFVDLKRVADVEKIGGDAAFLARLLKGFHDDVQHLIGQLDVLLVTGRHMEIGDVTHAIKGAALSVGAAQLVVHCDDIDKASIGAVREDLQRHVTEMRRCFERTDLEFHAYLSRKQRASL